MQIPSFTLHYEISNTLRIVQMLRGGLTFLVGVKENPQNVETITIKLLKQPEFRQMVNSKKNILGRILSKRKFF